MRFWLQDTFTAANHPVLKKICLLTAPGNTSKFNDDSFTNLEASYYTRLVLSDLFTLLEPPRHSDSDNNSAAGKVAMFEDGDHTIGAGRPSSPGSRASFSSSTVSRLTERSDLKSSTSSVGWSLSPKPLEEEEEEDGQFDYLSASVRPKSKAGPARLTQSVDRRRTKTAPMPQRKSSRLLSQSLVLNRDWMYRPSKRLFRRWRRLTESHGARHARSPARDECQCGSHPQPQPRHHLCRFSEVRKLWKETPQCVLRASISGSLLHLTLWARRLCFAASPGQVVASEQAGLPTLVSTGIRTTAAACAVVLILFCAATTFTCRPGAA